MSIAYQAYSPGYYSTRESLPYIQNGKTVYPPATHKRIPRENKKLFKDEDKCLRYCVKNGFQYEEVEIEE